ncbi:DUF726-domain-containing protein [Thozetella sp. PMI_491]|nr:DUF726-domain-containing protein [Thozetella sp. PMI_491]
MAPLASDPRQVLVVFNNARRKALYTLIEQITLWQRAQLELKRPEDPNTAPLFVSSPRGGTSDRTDTSHGTDANVSQRITPPPPELIRLRRAALAHFDEWRKGTLAKLNEIVSTPDDNKVLEARKRRAVEISQRRTRGHDLIDFGDDSGEDARVAGLSPDELAHAVDALQSLYHPIPTRLTTVSYEDREEALSCVLLLLLSTGNYTANSRVLVVYLASALALPLAVVIREETEIAKSLVESSAAAEKQNAAGGMSADAEAQKRKQENQSSRYWKVGLASVAGAALIGVTGGLAAPVVAGAIGGIMGSVGLGGVASFLGIFWMNGALVGTLFGAFGAKMTGEMIDQYAREVEDFRFLPLKDEWGKGYKKDDKDARRLKVIIGINGWLSNKDDVTRPWRVLNDDSEVFALRYEMDSLLSLGRSLEGLVSSYAWGVVKVEILKRTVLATLWSALWPAYLMKIGSNIDNPFNLARNRSDKAGKILADAIINKVQGERPVTLIGYSLGARVIYSCLRTLVERRAFGLVDSVVLIGAPIPSNRNHWQMMRSVVSGKMFNVYSQNDLVLAFLYRATSIQLGIAGLQEIKDIEGVENLNLTEEVKGHLRYPELIGQILTRCGFPDIKGGESPIEKEPDAVEIRLEDSDHSKMGTLIPLDDLKIADEPPPKPPRRAPATSSVVVEPSPSSPAPRSLEQLKARATTKWGDSVQDLSPKETKQVPPAYAAPHIAQLTGPARATPESDLDSDLDDDWGGITMENRDDDFDDMTYTEPIPIED